MSPEAIERSMRYLLSAVGLVSRFNPAGMANLQDGLRALTDMLDDQLEAIR